MKKPLISVNTYAKKYNSRRFPSLGFASYKEDGEEAALLAKVQESAKKAVNEAIEAAKANNVSKADLEAIENKFAETLKNQKIDLIQKDVQSALEQIQAMNENGNNKADLSVRDQIKKHLEANKDKFEAFKRGESKAFEIPVTMKAVATMLVSNATGSSAYLPYREIVPGFVDLVRNQPFLENYVNSSPTSRANIVWVNKVNPEGQAAMTAEGALKSQIDFNFTTETSTARKVTDFIKVSTEMIDDIDFVAAAIENELRYQIDMKVDEQLLTGDGTGQNLKGITEYASTFVLTTISTTTPNNSDAIMAGATQLKSLNHMANFAFVNPIDAANMNLQKSTTGEYVIPPFMSQDGVQIAGVRVIESNQIPVGSVLIADTTKYIKRDYKSLTVSYGWENDDFTKNLVTVLAERRLHAYASDNNTGAFLYDTFDNIKTAITLV